jgi:hypothetical protein
MSSLHDDDPPSVALGRTGESGGSHLSGLLSNSLLSTANSLEGFSRNVCGGIRDVARGGGILESVPEAIGV